MKTDKQIAAAGAEFADRWKGLVKIGMMTQEDIDKRMKEPYTIL